MGKSETVRENTKMKNEWHRRRVSIHRRHFVVKQEVNVCISILII